MKISFLTLLLFSLLACSLSAHADTEPQFFGVQRDAGTPTPSWKGTLLAVADKDEIGFQIWDIKSRRPLWQSEDHFLAFSHDDKLIAVGHEAQFQENKAKEIAFVQIDLLDAEDGHIVWHMDSVEAPSPDGEPRYILDHGFSRDGKIFRWATATHLYRFDLQQGVSNSRRWTKGISSVVLKDLAFIPGQEQVLAFDNETGIWSAATAKPVRSFPQSQAIKLAVPNVAWDFSPDGALFVATILTNTRSYVFRLVDGKAIWKCGNWPTFSPDGALAYVPTAEDTGFKVLDARTGRELREFPGPHNQEFALSPDGKWLYETYEGTIQRWLLK